MPNVITREKRRLAIVFEGAVMIALASQVAQVSCNTKDASPEDAGIDDAIAPQSTGADGGADVSAPSQPLQPCDPRPYSPPTPDTCGNYINFPCGLPQGVELRDGSCFLDLEDCSGVCPDINFNCHIADQFCQDASAALPGDGGQLIIDCVTCPNGVGRLPYGLLPTAHANATSELATYFSEAAHLEAASVFAFQQLRAQLEIYGAPTELLEATRDAERDEVRHARIMGRLARRFGGRYIRPCISTNANERHVDLETLATENLVEGCVRETYGALVANWQVTHARNTHVADALKTIADDELRHAALSWAIARHLMPLLNTAAQNRMAAACAVAIRELHVGYAASSSELTHEAGLPTQREGELLRGELVRVLWTSFTNMLEPLAIAS